MIDGLRASLDRIQRRADAVAAAFDEALALRPAQATGVDETGAVMAHLDPDGLPTALRVAPDWMSHLRPEQLGPAVVDACRAAATQWTAEWSRRLEDTAWRARAEARHPAPPRAGRPAPETTVPPRPVGEIADEAHTALRTAARTAPPPSAGGAVDGDRLTLTLTAAGLTACIAPPRWAAGQTGATLTTALTAALARARHALDGAPTTASLAPALDALLTEAMANLAAPGERSP